MSTPLTTTEINIFSGGMNTVLAPHLLRKDESIILASAAVRKGALWSAPKLIYYEVSEEDYFYQFIDDVYYYDTYRSNVLWDNRWYWTDGIDTGKVLKDGTPKALGLPTPTDKPTVVLTGAGPHKGDYKYCYTFYDMDTGVESAPSVLSDYITPSEEGITVSNFTALPVDATHYRIYRIGGWLPDFTLVETITSASYLDNLDDSQIVGSILQTIRNGPPPDGIQYFCELNGRMYGAVDNILYYSALGNPDSWYIYDYVPFRAEILGLAKTSSGLLVMGDDWCNMLVGSQPTTFVYRVVSDYIGLVDAKSIAYIDDSVIWLSKHGVVMSNGATIHQLTTSKIQDLSGIIAKGALVINNVYFLAFTKGEVDVFNTGGIQEGVITIDFNIGTDYSYSILQNTFVKSLGLLDGYVGLIHHEDPQTLGYINKYDEDHIEDLESLKELTYLSPVMIDGSVAVLKEYDKIRITFRGSFQLNVYFDNSREIINKVITSKVPEEYETVIIGILNEDNKSNSIQFFLQGIGIIQGIQYSWHNRELA